MTLQLREIVTNLELRNAVEICLQRPCLLPIGYSLKYQLEGRFPEASIRVFTNLGEPTYWFGCKINIFERKKMVFFEADPVTAFRMDELRQLLRSFLAATGIFDPDRLVPLSIASSLPGMDTFLREWYKELKVVKKFEITNYPCWFFSMGPKQMERFKTVNVSLPEGYYFDRINSDRDINVIVSTWRFVGEGEPEFTKARIRNLPSVCARTESGDIAAFAMADHYGPPIHLFTLQEHRRRGLSKATQTEMGKRMIEFGVAPFKYVETVNTQVIETSFKSKFMNPLRIVTWHELRPIIKDSKL